MCLLKDGGLFVEIREGRGGCGRQAVDPSPPLRPPPITNNNYLLQQGEASREWCHILLAKNSRYQAAINQPVEKSSSMTSMETYRAGHPIRSHTILQQVPCPRQTSTGRTEVDASSMEIATPLFQRPMGFCIIKLAETFLYVVIKSTMIPPLHWWLSIEIQQNPF